MMKAKVKAKKVNMRDNDGLTMSDLAKGVVSKKRERDDESEEEEDEEQDGNGRRRR